MNEIKITHELCAEDRARIDRLTAALEAAAAAHAPVIADPDQLAVDPELITARKKLEEMVGAEEAQNEPQAPVEEETPATIPTEEEAPAEAEEIAAEEPAKPTVTLEQIQQKVVQLCAGYDGKKKPAVRAIINAYGAKVSDLKDQPDKWGEVWEQLIALED